MPMLNPKLPLDALPLRAEPDAAPVVGDVIALGGAVAFVDSPARLLHERLAGHFEGVDVAPDERWSGAARLGFIVGASLCLWGAIGGVALLIA